MADYVTGVFLDFDNVFSALHKEDKEIAVAFATSPGYWLGVLEGLSPHDTDDAKHRFVVRRCYLNPEGKMPGWGDRKFSEFRQHFVRDGWEVIDTPPLTRFGKTSADIHIVMDVLDTLNVFSHVNEYIVMAADADYTPLVIRLRKHMKKTMIYMTENTATAYQAAADSVLSQSTIVQILSDTDEDTNVVEAAVAEPITATSPAQPITPTRVAESVHRYFKESAPGHKAPVASLGHLLRREFGPSLKQDGYLGHQTLAHLLKDLCNLKIERVEGRDFASV